MKRYGMVLGVLGLLLLGLALTQGMMGGFGPGMMGYGPQYGPGMMGYGMMGGHGMMGMMAVYPPEARPIPQAEAKARMEAYAKRLYPGARLKDFMAFSQNYYAQVVDEKGQGLFELIADRYTGVVSPEPGPNMMWNTRYSMMGGPVQAPVRFPLGLLLLLFARLGRGQALKGMRHLGSALLRGAGGVFVVLGLLDTVLYWNL
ncbi:hypothetical protein CSW29_08565 [Thermus scotoductus]|uniref:Uncharacterized protein n=1 Tax=Thermus scotoductus TaxID=37636 RepID=A0A430UG14_THESC|nr:hypothetical protein [Thermus scotoductus]RTH98995.1 hypothetical protein CSW29_08565 [Thermus scotoductus]